MSTQQCLTDERLGDLLVGEDNADAISHLESCVECQERITRLVCEEGAWDETSEMLRHAYDTDFVMQGVSESSEISKETDGVESGLNSALVETLIKPLLQPASHPELLGRLGRYDLERLLGVGGMGLVFKGFDSELNRPVAIKILSPQLATSGPARQRFAREARAAAAVLHDNVVAIHNVETEGELPFLVMQYVAGESLQERIDRVGPLQIFEIIRIAQQTAAGLSSAHAQGLVHRDVKPSNILLEPGVDRALLTDFGLARANDEATLTNTGFLAGTPNFMSPEQSRGEAIDARSDLFSLGSVLYSMCTGRQPFRSDNSYGVLRRINDTQPRAIRELNPDIPAWVVALIRKLHEKNPKDRISAEPLATLLQAGLAHLQNPETISLPKGCRELLRAYPDLEEQPSSYIRTTILSCVGVIGVVLTLWLWYVFGSSVENLAPQIDSTNWDAVEQQIDQLVDEHDNLESSIDADWTNDSLSQPDTQ